MCLEFAGGKSYSDVVSDFSKTDLTSDQKHFLVSTAVQTYCPENGGKVPSN